jgi:hypothetical protein
MQMFSRLLKPEFIMLWVALAFFSGCGNDVVEVIPETEEKLYQRGKYRLEQGRPEEALSAFLGVIDNRRVAPESHFEAAELFLTEFKDPVSAIYHYRKYLEFKPDSPQSPVVQERIETAQKEFAGQLPAQPFQGALDRLDLMELLDSVREENTRLKRQLLSARDRIESLESQMGIRSANSSNGPFEPELDAYLSPSEISEPDADFSGTPNAGDETPPSSYKVVSGYTLTRISVKVYGSESRWMDIYQANRDTMSSPNALRVGQVLRIP